MSRRRTYFDESLATNMYTFQQYYNWLSQIALTAVEWLNVPESIDVRFLELTLFENGSAVFFKDSDISDNPDSQFLALPVAYNGGFNVYNVPTGRRAYASNGYNRVLNEKDSVVIYNNYARTNDISYITAFAKRLYNIDRTIDVNVNAQKTPVLLQCDDTQKLSVKNAYKEFDGNAPVIFAGKNFDLNSFKVLTTNAPYICDRMYELKSQVWNEAMTYLGVANIEVAKKERLLKDEVQRMQGGVLASRNTRLMARKNACEQINKMFGLNMTVRYRDNLSGEYTKKDSESVVAENE